MLGMSACGGPTSMWRSPASFDIVNFLHQMHMRACRKGSWSRHTSVILVTFFVACITTRFALLVEIGQYQAPPPPHPRIFVPKITSVCGYDFTATFCIGPLHVKGNLINRGWSRLSTKRGPMSKISQCLLPSVCTVCTVHACVHTCMYMCCTSDLGWNFQRGGPGPLGPHLNPPLIKVTCWIRLVIVCSSIVPSHYKYR